MQKILYKILLKDGDQFFLLSKLAENMEQAELIAADSQKDLILLIEPITVEIPE